MASRAPRTCTTDTKAALATAEAREKNGAARGGASLSRALLAESLSQSTLHADYYPYRKLSKIVAPLGKVVPPAVAEAMRRSQRGKKRKAREVEVDVSDDDSDNEGQGSENEDSAKAALTDDAWEHAGHRYVDNLKRLVNERVTLPMFLQETLIHIIANHGHHTTDLSFKAAALLMSLLRCHPMTSLEAGLVVENPEVWQPMNCKLSSDVHAELLGGKVRYQLFHMLLSSAHEHMRALAAAHGVPSALAQAQAHAHGGGHGHGSGSGGGAAPAAAATAGGGAAGSGTDASSAPVGGDLGHVLLLEYFLAVLQQDLDVRVGVCQRAGWGGKASACLEGSLMYRMLDMEPKWALGSGLASKDKLLKKTVEMVVWGWEAGTTPPAPSAASALALLSRGTPRLGAPHLAELARQLLGLLVTTTGAAERVGSYKRKGQVARENERVCIDRDLNTMLLKEKSLLCSADHIQALLCGLPPAAAVRLLAVHVSELADKRVEGSTKGVVKPLPPTLAAVVAHFNGCSGNADAPPVVASTVLEFVVEEWAWANKVVRFGDLIPTQVGAAVFVLALCCGAAAVCDPAYVEAEAACQSVALEEVGALARAYRRVMEKLGGGGGGEALVKHEPCSAMLKRALDMRLLPQGTSA